MCNSHEPSQHGHAGEDGHDPLRRSLLLGSAAALGGLSVTGAAQAQEAATAVETGATRVTAWAASAVGGPFGPIEIERRAMGPKDVVLEVLYSGICHSDIHTVNADWGTPNLPLVPGHEIVGRVVAVGDEVTKFRVGDIGGVGCMVESCGECANCAADREQNCLNGTTFTYDSPSKIEDGALTYGGYSQRMVVTEHFVIRIPPGMDLTRVAPLLCAGVTTFSPLRHWSVQPGWKVGVIGIGGLGHMAVKLAVAHRAEVTAFTTSPGKVEAIAELGAAEAVLWDNAERMRELTGQFDLLISTVPVSYPMDPFMALLKLDGTLVNVGALGQLEGLNGMMQGFGRKSLAGSMIGGIAETQEMIDYCAARGIAADVELIAPAQIDEAYARVQGKDVRYRFVIDVAGQG